MFLLNYLCFTYVYLELYIFYIYCYNIYLYLYTKDNDLVYYIISSITYVLCL